MPIYEYLCNSCGAEKEHFQKMSDAPIKVCPECGSEAYTKLVSAAGFQLKGSGWYVTDFKNKPTQPASNSEKSDATDKTKSAGADADSKKSATNANSTSSATDSPKSTTTTSTTD